MIPARDSDGESGGQVMREDATVELFEGALTERSRTLEPLADI